MMMLFMAAIAMVMMLFVTTSAAVPLLTPTIVASIIMDMRVVLVAVAAALASMVMLVAVAAAAMVRMRIVIASIALVTVAPALAGAFVLGRFGCHALSFPFSISAKSTFLLQPLQVFLYVAILEYPKSASKNGLSNLPRFR